MVKDDLTSGLGERMRARRKALGLTQAKLAQEVSKSGFRLSQQNVNSIESGQVNRPGAIIEIARVLKTTVEWLRTGNGPEDRPEFERRSYRRFAPLLPSAPTKTEGLMHLWSTNDVFGDLFAKKELYSFFVYGDPMSPAVEHGDEVMIDPRLAPVAQTDCVFLQAELDGRRLVVIRRLLAETSTSWRVRQFNPPRDLSLPKQSWPTAHVITTIRRAVTEGPKSDLGLEGENR